METIIVGLIVGAAALYCIRSFVKKYKAEDTCGGGCSCDLEGTCCGSAKKVNLQ